MEIRRGGKGDWKKGSGPKQKRERERETLLPSMPPFLPLMRKNTHQAVHVGQPPHHWDDDELRGSFLLLLKVQRAFLDLKAIVRERERERVCVCVCV